MKYAQLFLLCFAVISCSNTASTRFTKMTQSELDAYNATVSAEDRVYCGERRAKWAQTISTTVCVTAKQAERDALFSTTYAEKNALFNGNR